MHSIQHVEDTRNRILEELREVRSLRRGTINEQFVESRRKKGAEPVMRGPYYVLSRREGGKTVSRRLKSREDLEQAQHEIAEHKRFARLCKDLEQQTERLGELIRQDQQQEKKDGGVRARQRAESASRQDPRV